MRLDIINFIVIYLTFIVSARRHKKSDDDSNEFYRRHIDLTGKVRRQFGLEAALVHPGNVICSPTTELISLGHLAMGATKKTERELLNALGLKSSKQIKHTFKKLIEYMVHLPDCKLDVASGIFVSKEKGFSLSKKFEKCTHDIFKASIKRISPSNPNRAKTEINTWITGKMRHKMKNITSLDLPQTTTTLVLVSVVYFSGIWQNRFDRIFKEQFSSPSGTSQEIEMMSKRAKLLYLNSPSLKSEIIKLPYQNNQSSMIIVLPNTNIVFEDILKALKLAPELLNDALLQMKYEDVLVTMPKFIMESELDLNSLYQKIGLSSIFNSGHSHLNRIVKNENVTVTKAIHKAVFEVHEKGKPSSVRELLSVPPSNVHPLQFKADHPFMFYVIANQEQLLSGVFRGPV